MVGEETPQDAAVKAKLSQATRVTVDDADGNKDEPNDGDGAAGSSPSSRQSPRQAPSPLQSQAPASGTTDPETASARGVGVPEVTGTAVEAPSVVGYLLDDSESPGSEGHVKKSKRNEPEIVRTKSTTIALFVCTLALIVAAVVVPLAVVRPWKSNGERTLSKTELSALVEELTPSGAYNDATTPQGQAYRWLWDNYDEHGPYIRDRVIQRYVLAAVYFALGGQHWRFGEVTGTLVQEGKWLSSASECTWIGAQCRVVDYTEDGDPIRDDTIKALNFHVAGITNVFGHFPLELTHLRRLFTLNFEDNDSLLTTIPSFFGDISTLEVINFAHCGLRGTIPTTLGKLKGLLRLDLSDNFLTGSLPTELGAMETLVKLRLESNRKKDTGLEGGIPPHLGNLTHLNEILLQQNNINSTIPTELAKCQLLEVLEVSEARLSGTIPTELSLLGKLESLHLDDNFLDGTIPPELGDLSYLKELVLTRNRFTGTIPTQLGKLSNMVDFRINDQRTELSGLHGTLPTQLANLTLLGQLSVSKNRLTGRVPTELGEALADLEILRLHENFFTGEVPSELGLLTKLEILQFHENNFTDPIPTELGQLTNLRQLNLQGNDWNLTEMPVFLCDLEEFRLKKLTGDTCDSPESCCP